MNSAKTPVNLKIQFFFLNIAHLFMSRTVLCVILLNKFKKKR